MRPNNFDLLRLLAAVSVVFFHTIYRLEIEVHGTLKGFFSFIPGVPIFFFISGFLISLSYSKSTSLKSYIKKRVLRIYPALYLCLLLSIGSVIYIGYLKIDILLTKDFWIWILAQISFLQFYNPEFLRGYGVGTLNGSLWTISVELQFYILIPILYSFINDNKNIKLISIIVIFSILNILVTNLGSSNDFKNQSILYKLLFVSFIPWFYMFLIGIFVQENFDKFKILYEMRIFYKIAYSVIIIYVFYSLGMNPLTFFLFITILFIFVYSLRDISYKVLKENDYSYGIYIYHALVINSFVYLGYSKDIKYLLYVYLLSFLCAAFSWHILEKPILSYKKGIK